MENKEVATEESTASQSACPSCGSSKELNMDFCSNCTSFMVDMMTQEDEFVCAKSTGLPAQTTPTSQIQEETQVVSQEQERSEEQVDSGVCRALDFTSCLEKEDQGTESSAPSCKKRKLVSTENSEEAGPVSATVESPQTPERRSTALSTVVTPPSSQTSIRVEGDSIILNLKINAADAFTKQWLFEAQCQGAILDIGRNGSKCPPAKAQITALTVLSSGQGVPGLAIEPHKTNFSQSNNSTTVTKPKSTCCDCGGEKEDDWRAKCKTCFAKQMYKDGLSNRQRGTCEDCGEKTEKEWMFKCRTCFSNGKVVEEKSVKGEKASEPEGEGRTCVDCRKCKTSSTWMNRCSDCFRKYRQSQADKGENKGGKCRYCSNDLGDPLRTCCGPCFDKYKKNKTSGSSKCPHCGKEPEDPSWMIWCSPCYMKRK